MKKLFIIFALVFSTQGYSYSEGSFGLSNTNFEFLYNNHRLGGPEVAPWVGSWWAYKNNGIDHGENPNPRNRAKVQSPAYKFDKFFKLGNKTASWERSSHTCDNQTGESKESCEGWWGHCNAWAAAAIKEAEPRESFNKGGINWNVADQKAIMSELYMENYSLFVGQTNKGVKTELDWVFNPDHAESKKLVGRGVSTYDAFWDVSPRSFFFILTNYLGLKKVGVVIDRFTGDQVWNQPLAGYRLLPISKQFIKPAERRDGKKVYPVLMRANIYWAEDGVWEHAVSLPFNYKTDTSDEFYVGDHHVSKHYKSRSLAFYLYFDKPVQVTSDGLRVKSAGRVVGDGVWYHQTEEGKKLYLSNKISFNDLHPDFMWFPNKVNDEARRNYRNPYVNSNRVTQIMAVKDEEPTPVPVNQSFTCVYKRESFFGRLKNTYRYSSKNSYEEACNGAYAKCQKDRKGLQSCNRS